MEEDPVSARFRDAFVDEIKAVQLEAGGGKRSESRHPCRPAQMLSYSCPDARIATCSQCYCEASTFRSSNCGEETFNAMTNQLTVVDSLPGLTPLV